VGVEEVHKHVQDLELRIFDEALDGYSKNILIKIELKTLGGYESLNQIIRKKSVKRVRGKTRNSKTGNSKMRNDQNTDKKLFKNDIILKMRIF